MKRLNIISLIGGSSAVRIGEDGDRGCVSCGTVYCAEWYTSDNANTTLIVDNRGRYWCLDCAIKDLANVRRRVDERTSTDYPWRYQDTVVSETAEAVEDAATMYERLEQLAKRNADKLYERMQRPGFREAALRAFAATPEELGEAAVAACQRRDDTPTAKLHTNDIVRPLPDAKSRKPEFSYVRLGNGMCKVTCTCGWEAPPDPVGPFDPEEALAVAWAVHPCCPDKP